MCLIPELCYITGLTDAIRQDFRVMKVRDPLSCTNFGFTDNLYSRENEEPLDPRPVCEGAVE